MALITPISSNYQLIPKSDIKGIANAIRTREGSANLILSGAMPDKILNLPNVYSAANNGMVVMPDGNGGYGLQTQVNATYSSNGTRDTTNIKSVTVDNCYEPYVNISDFEIIVKNGNGPRRFPLHSRIRVGQDLWAEVVSYDTDTDLDDPNAHTATLWPIVGLRRREFDARQKFVIALQNLAAKGYAYKVGSNSWRTITLRSITPEGGYIVFTGDDHTNVSTYDQSGTLIESDGATATAGLVTHFEDLNGSSVLTNGISSESYSRALYGSNCYLRSAIRKYVAENATNWANGFGSGDLKWGLPPSYASEPGFQSLLYPEVLSKLKRVAVVCANTTAAQNTSDPDIITDTSYTITTDRLFLPSITNLGIGANGGIQEGPVWQAFDQSLGGNIGYYERIRKAIDGNSLLYFATRSAVITTTHKIYEGTQISGTDIEYDANSSSLSVVPAFVI